MENTLEKAASVVQRNTCAQFQFIVRVVSVSGDRAQAITGIPAAAGARRPPSAPTKLPYVRMNESNWNSELYDSLPRFYMCVFLPDGRKGL